VIDEYDINSWKNLGIKNYNYSVCGKNKVVSKKSNKLFDKSSMQVLWNLKQQLKSPMSGGKWF
jgi:hypothetical protein